MSTLASVVGRDVLASRPAAGIAGRLFEATDTSIVYRDNGSSWDTYATVGIIDPTTTRGDLIARGAATLGRLALGATGLPLVSDGTDPGWGNPLTYLDFTVAAAPANPGAGKLRVYAKSGGDMAQRDSAGTEVLLDATGGGGGGGSGVGDKLYLYNNAR